MELPPLYVSYEEASETEGLFVYLPDSQAAAIAVENKRQKLHRVTRIKKTFLSRISPLSKSFALPRNPSAKNVPERSHKTLWIGSWKRDTFNGRNNVFSPHASLFRKVSPILRVAMPPEEGLPARDALPISAREMKPEEVCLLQYGDP
ncbi:hypothetical protein LC607_35290 [Nostoc sp. CHAB 5824]|nr:hypothetical protein [Nostoc sp. CHAB 5824]